MNSAFLRLGSRLERPCPGSSRATTLYPRPARSSRVPISFQIAEVYRSPWNKTTFSLGTHPLLASLEEGVSNNIVIILNIILIIIIILLIYSVYIRDHCQLVRSWCLHCTYSASRCQGYPPSLRTPGNRHLKMKLVR